MATAIITIGYEEPAGSVDRVETALEQLAFNSPNWNGANFEIVRGDFTDVEYSGPNYAEELNLVVNRAIDPNFNS